MGRLTRLFDRTQSDGFPYSGMRVSWRAGSALNDETRGGDSNRKRGSAMRIEKKQTIKEDGRYLVYYHFPDSASEEQTTAYEEIQAADQPDLTGTVESAKTLAAENEDKSRV